MRIGVVTPWDSTDPRAWSGMVQPMIDGLRAHADVVVFETGNVRDSVVDRTLARLLDRRFGRQYLVGHALATSLKRGRELTRRLRETPLDVVLAIAASQDIAFLRTEIPVVQVSDTTFRAIKDFYPQFSNLDSLSAIQAEAQSKLATRRTWHTLAATEWARDALVRDGVHTEDVTVAPFGPAVQPNGVEPRRPPTGPLRLLMVSSDWERKGGADVLATWAELRGRGVDCSLTVAGNAPELPAGVHRLGRVTADEMRELYATHHVLVELATSNAAGVTLTDAAGFGLPVVATHTGGVSSIVEDGVTGFLVPRGGVTVAADCIERLADPDLRQAMGTAASERADSTLNWRAWGEAAVTACESTRTKPSPGAAITQTSGGLPGATGQIVFLSPAIPYPGIEHAGGQYIRRLNEAVSRHTTPCWMAMDRPSVRHALRQPGVVTDVVLLGDAEDGCRLRRGLYRCANWLGSQSMRIDSQALPLGAALDLLINPAARRAVRQARLVDFQWANYAKLSSITRLLNPTARLHFTFHDVMSQKFDRSAASATGNASRAKWRLRAALSRRWERRAIKVADLCLVFSEKDRALLDPTGKGNVAVINPPLAEGQPPVHESNTSGRVLFVGFMARQENIDGLMWFLRSVWPLVLASAPHASLRVAGGSMPPSVQQRIAAHYEGVEVLGFVPDLEDEYRAASAVVVPLQAGAGVKFKTIDALLQGVPVVCTTIGAEGIGGSELFAGLADEPTEFAGALTRALLNNQEAVAQALPVQGWAWDRYSLEGFERTVDEFYFRA